MNKHSHSDPLAKAMAKARAERGMRAEDDELVCPQCGFQGDESEFDTAPVEESDDTEGDDGEGAEDSYRTDPLTTSTQNDDDVNERDADQVPKWDNRRIDRLNALTKSLVAQTLKSKL